ncbi:hypothetical protein Pcac1_g21777 [Phytophthora cactorum]|nr:hypothetical protein Pcac1_g21777 [Phytophthora cactorum]
MRFRSFEDPNTQAFARGNSTEESAYAEIESTTYAIPSSSGFDRHTSATACNGDCTLFIRIFQRPFYRKWKVLTECLSLGVGVCATAAAGRQAEQRRRGLGGVSSGCATHAACPTSHPQDAAQRSPTKTNQDNLSRTGFTTLKSLLRRLEISLDSQQDFEQLSWQLVSILTQIESPDAVCNVVEQISSLLTGGVSIETFDDVQHYLEQFREDVEKEKKMEKEEEKDSSLELLGSPTLQNLWNEGKMDDDELLLSPIHSGSGDVSQYSLRQVDRFRVTAINQSSSDTDPKRKYCDCGEWICVITSEYGLRELGTIVKPSYYMYEELWSKGHMLGGRRVAFKNYVHTMARDGEEIELQLRPYDRSKTDQHTYAAVKLKASKLRNDGRNAAECKAIMQILWDVDYWYPLDRCLATIDSAAMLTIGEQNAAGLAQIRKSPTHKTDLNVLDEYAGLFPQAWNE